MDELPDEINVITLNCWGLKYISKLRASRLGEIGRKLAAADPAPHVVALQECWCRDDYRRIRRETRDILPHGKFYHGGVFGAGLAILSRWPIQESSMLGYPLNGRPTAFWRGDWYVGKGIAWAKIRYGPGPKHLLEVFNTHTHAAYGEAQDSYLVHRTAQAWEMAKHLRGAVERGHLVLAVGDFNTVPSSTAYRLIASGAAVRDVWRVLHPDGSLGPADDMAEPAPQRPVPTVAVNLAENGATCDSVLNTWRWDGARQKRLARAANGRIGAGADVWEAGEFSVPLDTPDPKAKRIDYIFASTGDVTALGGGWVVKSAAVGMTARHPTLGCSLSDHFSVEATLVFHPSAPGAIKDANAKNKASSDDDEAATRVSGGTYLHSPSETTSSSASPRGSLRRSYDIQLSSANNKSSIPPATYDDILDQLHNYLSREQRQRRWRGAHCFLSVAVAVGCYVGVWFSPANWVSFILVLVSSLGLVAGTVDGLLALLFFGSEIRALEEFEWEIVNAKAMATGRMPMEEEAKDKGR